MSAVSTAERLGKALAAAGAPPQMVSRAYDGYYDDYKSPLALPIMQLVNDAVSAGLPQIAERARHGDFDATREEADAWAHSPEGQQAFRDLLGDVGGGPGA